MALLNHGYYSGYRRGYGPSPPWYEVGSATDTPSIAVQLALLDGGAVSDTIFAVGRPVLTEAGTASDSVLTEDRPAFSELGVASDSLSVVGRPSLPETGTTSDVLLVWGPLRHGYYGGYFAGYGSGLVWRETASAVDTLVSWDPYNVGPGGYTGGYLVGYGSSVLDGGTATDTFSVVGLGAPIMSETPNALDTLNVFRPQPVFFESGRAQDALQLPGYSGGYVNAGYLEPLGTAVPLFEVGSASDALVTGSVYLYETGLVTDTLGVGVALFESATSSDAAFGHSTVVDFTKTLPELSTASETMQIGGAAQPYSHGKGLTVIVRSGAGSVRAVISGGTLAVVLKSSQSSAALQGDRGKSAAVVQ